LVPSERAHVRDADEVKAALALLLLLIPRPSPAVMVRDADEVKAALALLLLLIPRPSPAVMVRSRCASASHAH
ncbi:SPOSA6832_03700, partial [Sporobolomyces salmonicolor]